MKVGRINILLFETGIGNKIHLGADHAIYEPHFMFRPLGGGDRIADGPRLLAMRRKPPVPQNTCISIFKTKLIRGKGVYSSRIVGLCIRRPARVQISDDKL
jgi:hypothetical protein